VPLILASFLFCLGGAVRNSLSGLAEDRRMVLAWRLALLFFFSIAALVT